MKKKYAYQVGGVAVATREAARMIQRSFPTINVHGEPVKAPRITQKITMERIVR
ncbi:hypothetical protein D3C75_603600 [compost metagenome]